MDKIKHPLLWLLLSLILCACSGKKISERESVSFFKKIFDKNTYSIHRIDVEQGNYLPQEKVAQLQPGLSKEQVSYLLGTPITSTLFHRDRWDYVYYIRHGKTKQRELYTVVLFFNDDKLAKITKSKYQSKQS